MKVLVSVFDDEDQLIWCEGTVINDVHNLEWLKQIVREALQDDAFSRITIKKLKE